MKFAAIAALALTVGFGAVTTASAVTFTLTGGTPYTLPHNFNPNPGAPGLAKGDIVHQNATLGLSAPGRVTVTYGGTEAGYTNSFLLDGVKLFDNKTGGAPVGPVDLGAGTVPFAFTTKNPSGSFGQRRLPGDLRLARLLQAQRHLGLCAVQRQFRRATWITTTCG